MACSTLLGLDRPRAHALRAVASRTVRAALGRQISGAALSVRHHTRFHVNEMSCASYVARVRCASYVARVCPEPCDARCGARSMIHSMIIVYRKQSSMTLGVWIV